MYSNLGNDNKGWSSSESLPTRIGELVLSPGGNSWTRRYNEYLSTSVNVELNQSGATRKSRSESRSSTGSSVSQRSRSMSASLRSQSGSSTSEDGRRSPFYYRERRSTHSADGSSLLGTVDADPIAESLYRRYLYYSRLQNQTGVNIDLLSMPSHVIPATFYLLNLPGTSQSNQSSLVTIFSLWNIMLGTSLLSMPWALQQSGLLMGVFMTFLVTGVCCYTAHLILKEFEQHSKGTDIRDFSDMCYHVLGRWGQVSAIFFSLLAILGCVIVLWILMTGFLYAIVGYFYDLYIDFQMDRVGVYCPSMIVAGSISPSDLRLKNTSDVGGLKFDDIWGQYSTAPLVLALILFPLVSLKSVTFFTKLNSLGTISVFFILFSVMYRSFQWGWNSDFSDTTAPQYIPLMKASFPSLTGVLTLGLFIHNAVITIMANNRHQENNGRDLCCGYFLAMMTYLIVGVLFFLSFPLDKSCIEDNLLNNFQMHDALSAVSKMFLLLQMMVTFPLVTYLLRVTFFLPVFHVPYPGFKFVLLLNISIVSICIAFTIFFPQIGTIARYSGAACGMNMVFTLPVLVHLWSGHKASKLSCSSLTIHSVIIAIGAANLYCSVFHLKEF